MAERQRDCAQSRSNCWLLADLLTEGSGLEPCQDVTSDTVKRMTAAPGRNVNPFLTDECNPFSHGLGFADGSLDPSFRYVSRPQIEAVFSLNFCCLADHNRKFT